jgi:integrase
VGKIRTNLIAGVKPLKVPPGRVRYLEQEEFTKLLKHCSTKLRRIVVIGAYTGMRRGEILRLERPNIDKKHRRITLEKTKNNERRMIPMRPLVWEIVGSLPPRLDTPDLFAEDNGTPLSADSVTIAFKHATKRAGIDTLRYHDLRHPLCLTSHDEGPESAHTDGVVATQKP